MSVIGWIVLGLIVGVVANWIVKGGFGLVGSTILGIIGAVVGGAIASFLTGADAVGRFDYLSLVFAVFGAILVVGFFKVILGRGSEA